MGQLLPSKSFKPEKEKKKTGSQIMFLVLVEVVTCLCSYVSLMQTPPPLDVPLKLIGKDPVAKDINWEDDGVLVSSTDMDIF